MEPSSTPPHKHDYFGSVGIAMIILLLILGGIYVILSAKARLHEQTQIEQISA